MSILTAKHEAVLSDSLNELADMIEKAETKSKTIPFWHVSKKMDNLRLRLELKRYGQEGIELRRMKKGIRFIGLVDLWQKGFLSFRDEVLKEIES